jgi:6-phosphogluconolactonase
MALEILDTLEETLSALAAHIIKIGQESIRDRGRFTFSLSGGSSPKRLYSLLASDSYTNQLDWTKVYFFFGDERYVPFNHPDSNYLMVKTVFFDPLHIQDSQIFPFQTQLEVKEAGLSYYKTLLSFFGKEPIQFDLILLGLGDNSHTASLFPHTPILHDRVPGTSSVFLEDQKVFRLTFNAPLINLAHHIAFLVFGLGKAEAVRHILEGTKDIEEYPAQLIHPLYGETTWFMDTEAASLIKKS